ncbi:DUF5930 domain-containing protein [Phaeobacter piscinae]|uniref:DUF5930 domain-containing protein n=1 Tax=Phaeobacter piscinae TaxID=1580596 RepID=UPI0039F71274
MARERGLALRQGSSDGTGSGHMEPAGGAPGTAAPQLGQDKDQSVRTRLAIKIHAFLERRFPERRVFLKSRL